MALTAGRNTTEVVDGKYLILPVKANTRIYEGSLVAIDSTGYAIPGKKEENLLVAGRAEEFVDNTGSGNSNGAKTIKVKRGVFKWNNDSTDTVTDQDILKPCYILDDSTVTALSTATSIAGKVIGIENNQVLVEMK